MKCGEMWQRLHAVLTGSHLHGVTIPHCNTKVYSPHLQRRVGKGAVIKTGIMTAECVGLSSFSFTADVCSWLPA